MKKKKKQSKQFIDPALYGPQNTVLLILFLSSTEVLLFGFFRVLLDHLFFPTLADYI